MIVAAFIGQKGGVGKSALARVLAVSAAHQGKSVLIADYDLEQLSCVEWGATRLKNGIEPEVEVRAFKSLKKLRKSAEGFDLVVVDTRGLADDFTEEICLESDVVFLPTGTSMDDLRPTIGLAKRLMRQKGAINKVMIVLSKTGRSERQVEQALSFIESSGFECLSAAWPQRDGFQSDFDGGKAGSESSNPHLKQAALDIEKALLACL
jgi:chromosome partitioning protein